MKTIKANTDLTRNVEILTWLNKATGEKRNERMVPVTVENSKCNNLYLDECGNFYTRGIIGWCPVNKYM